MDFPEEWRAVPAFPGYEVSNLGRIRTSRWSKKPHVMAEKTDQEGYRSIALRRCGRLHYLKIHRLVLATFTEPSMQPVNHRDGDKSNNALTNLEWSTPAENIRHAVRAGLIKSGSASRLAKFTDAQVAIIRAEYAAGAGSMLTLARKYGVAVFTIYQLLRGKRYGVIHADL